MLYNAKTGEKMTEEDIWNFIPRDDLEGWAKRWEDCSPGTYPPELWSDKAFEVEFEACRVLFWKRIKTQTVWRAVCRRCEERIRVGHTCADISEYNKSLRTAAALREFGERVVAALE